ncbi:MAG: radical SAM protein [Polyangiaceae bacterium]
MTFVTAGLEHLGVAALAAYARQHGHRPSVVHEGLPFSSNTGTDNRLLARVFEPSQQETAERILATRPDLVAFSSYTITHQWSLGVARAVRRRSAAPIVFGGPHVSGAPERSIRESVIDAVVEGEGEGALLDLLDSVERDGALRTDIQNCWFRKANGDVIRNPLRPLIQDLDTLPWADKQGFYASVPAFEREFYIVSRRGCPYRCSFCEYSIFPKQYPGEKPVRRRSVQHLMDELIHYKRRGVMKKVFFWDAIFTLDNRWMAEFAEAYRQEIGLPYECYTHPHAMNREMAKHLAHAGEGLIRIGVQTVNSDTLAAMDRKGDQDKVSQALQYMRDFGLSYSLDHILGLPGETADDQRKAVEFYNQVRPERVIVHWMTYFPGTTALLTAVDDGLLTQSQVDDILDGKQTDGFEAPRLVGAGAHKRELEEVEAICVLYDLMPLLPQAAIDWLLETRAYRFIPRGTNLRQMVGLVRALYGDLATRERMRLMLRSAVTSSTRVWKRRLGRWLGEADDAGAVVDHQQASKSQRNSAPSLVRRRALPVV